MTRQPRLCVTVTGRTTDELRQRRDAAGDADLVELRLDTVADPDVAGALRGRRTPVIVTCRSAEQGGRFAGSEDERRTILREALASDAEYVDLEWPTAVEALAPVRGGRGVVCSLHDFSGVPADLGAVAAAMARSGSDVVKLAVAVTRLTDNVPLLNVARSLGATRHVLIGMGHAGAVTRVCGGRFGNEWTYAGDAVAPGQMSASRLLREFHARRLSPAAAVYGVVGRPVGHSLSPAMHNAGFAELGLDAVYLPLAAVDLADFAAFASAFELAGASVTAPFKAEAMRLAGEIDGVAEEVGAVNTLTWRDGRVLGANTDVEGFLAPLAPEPLEGRRAAVLGDGGAARAVAVALRRSGARVTLYGRDGERARRVAARVGAEGAARPVPPRSWDLLVNATPVGTYPDVTATAYPEATFDGPLVYDLVYNPPATRLLCEARAAGCRTIPGLEMLVAQAQAQQRVWFGRSASAGVMARAAHERLSASERDV